MNSRYDSSLLHGVAEELIQTGHDLMVVNATRLRAEGESLGQMLFRRGVGGALVRTTSLTNSMCDELGTQRFPTVSVANRMENHQIGCAYYDTDKAVRRALEHLVHLGHRKTAIALNVVDDFDHSARLRSHQRFLEEAGLPQDERWVLRCSAAKSSGVILRQILSLRIGRRRSS